MRLPSILGATAATALAVAIACSSPPPHYPACRTDLGCARDAEHDYCVAGRCVVCRTSIDCGDREMCRAGACKPDPNAPPPPVLDAGDDATDDAPDEDGSTDDEDGGAAVDDDAPRESPRLLPRGVRRFLHP